PHPRAAQGLKARNIPAQGNALGITAPKPSRAESPKHILPPDITSKCGRPGGPSLPVYAASIKDVVTTAPALWAGYNPALPTAPVPEYAVVESDYGSCSWVRRPPRLHQTQPYTHAPQNPQGHPT